MKNEREKVCYIIRKRLLDRMNAFTQDKISYYKKGKLSNETVERVIEITNENDLHKEPSKRFNIEDSPKKKAVLTRIIYMLSDRSYSFAGREKLMEKYKCSVDVINDVTRLLKETGLFVVMYLKNPKSNGYKTPVFFYTEHQLYQSVKQFIIGIDSSYKDAFVVSSRYSQAIVQATLSDGATPCQDWDRSENRETTFSYFLKQEKNNNYSETPVNLKLINNLSTEVHNSGLSTKKNAQIANIVRYMTYKVADAVNRGTDISHLSSYAEKVFTKEFERANRKEEEARKKAFKKQVLPVKEDKPVVASTAPIPFVNWLEDDYSEVPLLQTKPVSTETLKAAIVKHISLFHNTCSEDYIQFNNLVIKESAKLGINEHTSITSTLEKIKNICAHTYNHLEYELLRYVRKHNFFNTSKDCLEDII